MVECSLVVEAGVVNGICELAVENEACQLYYRIIIFNITLNVGDGLIGTELEIYGKSRVVSCVVYFGYCACGEVGACVNLELALGNRLGRIGGFCFG